MINSVHDINSSGDAIEFVEDNIEYLTAIEKVVTDMYGLDDTDNRYETAAMFLEALFKKMWVAHLINRESL